MDSPAAAYATDPHRTALGAAQILKCEIRATAEACQLATVLEGDSEGARHNRELLEIIALRLQEAKLLASRL